MLQETVERPMPACRDTTGLRGWIVGQFARPQGWRGWIVGQLIAIKNRERSLWVLSLLDLRPTDHVLEIGFGSGVDICRVAERVPHGFVAGIDHSAAMLRQATSRNREMIRAARVELRQGSASELPYAANSFDAVYAINVAQFWDVPVNTVREIRRVLKPGGLAVLAVQPRNKGATEETAQQTGATLSQALTVAGFRSVRLERRAMKPVSTVCALGRK
jgi:ubiquinone/menaquinone biosynthesis C-methylase UbiE